MASSSSKRLAEARPQKGARNAVRKTAKKTTKKPNTTKKRRNKTKKTPNKAGRTSKLTPEIQQSICAKIASGTTYIDAVALSGVGKTAFYRWKALGQKAKSGKYAEFRDAIDKAETSAREVLLRIAYDGATQGQTIVENRETFDARGVSTGLVVIKRKTKSDPRMAMLMLERRYPEEFGRRVIQHEGAIATENRNIAVHLSFDGKPVDDDNLPADDKPTKETT